MSWQDYVDNQLIASKCVSKAAIAGHDGALWAKSAGFEVMYKFIVIYNQLPFHLLIGPVRIQNISANKNWLVLRCAVIFRSIADRFCANYWLLWNRMRMRIVGQCLIVVDQQKKPYQQEPIVFSNSNAVSHSGGTFGVMSLSFYCASSRVWTVRLLHFVLCTTSRMPNTISVCDYFCNFFLEVAPHFGLLKYISKLGHFFHQPFGVQHKCIKTCVSGRSLST